MATVGQPLTAPEAGWKRFDDTTPQVSLYGTWTKQAFAGPYQSTFTHTTTVGSTLKFDFTGTKLRIIADMRSDRSANIQLKIDGVTETYSAQNGIPTNIQATYQLLLYEKTGLADTRHTVEMICTETLFTGLDAVDIDATGRLLHPDEVIDPNSLQVGKRIRCHYTATTTGAVGVFSGLGLETSDFIPTASSATPNGDFYFIMVGTDFLGRSILTSTINVQNSVSWDALNTAGIASSSGLPIVFYDSNNLALGKPVFAGDVLAGYPPENAVDGTTSTIWYTNYTGTGGGSTARQRSITIDLGVSTEVRKLTVSTAYGADTFDISASHDNVNFVPIQTGNTIALNTTKEFAISNKGEYRYWSIENIKTSYGATANIGLAEVQLFQSANRNGTFVARLPQGGVSSTDKDNEWDRYIVEGTGYGPYTAGDNNLWNWSAGWSWTSSVNTGGDRLNRTIRGNSSAAASSFTATSTATVAYGFRPVLIFETAFIWKYLFEDSGKIKSLLDGAWVELGFTPATQLQFITNGLDSLVNVTDSLIRQLTENKVLLWSADPEVNEKKLQITAVPVPKLILPTGDIMLTDVAGIDKVTLNATQTGSGKVRIIVSTDKGVTWKTYNLGWVAIDPTVDAVATGGLSPATLNDLTRAEWDALTGSSSRTIRFGYYLEIDTTLDKAETDAIITQWDMKGFWGGAIHGTDYDFLYADNNLLRVHLYSNGSYKINYQG